MFVDSMNCLKYSHSRPPDCLQLFSNTINTTLGACGTARQCRFIFTQGFTPKPLLIAIVAKRESTCSSSDAPNYGRYSAYWHPSSSTSHTAQHNQVEPYNFLPKFAASYRPTPCRAPSPPNSALSHTSFISARTRPNSLGFLTLVRLSTPSHSNRIHK